jgi:hypothetical protein
MPAKGVVMTGSESSGEVSDFSDFFLECVFAVVFEDFDLDDLCVVDVFGLGAFGVEEEAGLSFAV